MTQLFPSIAKTPWQSARWPNFRAKEIACHHGQCVYCDGEVWLDEDALDALQRMRNILNAPIEINSGHRCPQHNRAVGGARHSAHLELAFDISLARHARPALFEGAAPLGLDAETEDGLRKPNIQRSRARVGPTIGNNAGAKQAP